jgi:5-formyltetrahydrofolate cyclo-ligase
VERIEALPEFASARTVALYSSLPDEVPTSGMLARWRGLKRLVLPVVLADGEMIFREYTGAENLASGALGTLEPVLGATVPSSEIDLMIVPGVAFDRNGHRLGRGGGFYDRYLSHPAATHIYKVGLCPSGALVSKVPTEPHDVAMDVVITDFK